MLALTFGVPVVAPAVGGMVEAITPETGRTFHPADEGALRRALESADELRTPSARAAARAVADQYDPDMLSARFASAVRERVGAAA
jgi:glycosyltransferase involved in cell wall biosynthesis